MCAKNKGYIEKDIDILSNQLVYVKGELKTNINKMMSTKTGYRIQYDSTGPFYPYKLCQVEIKEKIEKSTGFENKLNYFNSIAQCKDESSKETSTFYSKQIQKLDYIDKESALISYFNSLNKKRDKIENLIFPFSLNASQMDAVNRSFEHQITMIQGPPGTGKTQTILNLIANVVVSGRSIAVVSPNNAATNNVFLKLKKAGFDFIGAQLGNADNRKAFYSDIPEVPKELDTWELDENAHLEIKQRLHENQKEIKTLLKEKNRLAKLQHELREWEIEQKYFELYLNETKSVKELKQFRFTNFNLDKKKSFLIDTIVENISDINILKKARFFFKYGIYQFKQFKSMEEQMNIIRSVEAGYYREKIRLLNSQIKTVESYLVENRYEKLLKAIEDQSLLLFKNALFDKYHKNRERVFSQNAHKNDAYSFTEQFPVVLSTCDSILESIAEDRLFDYVVDEASMASLVPSIFPLGVAKNIIVVGDEKQLPHIAMPKNVLRTDIDIPKAYDYFEQNLLSSLQEVYKEDLPTTLLKEHYRCHPMIINFCNKQYYNNELVIMSAENLKAKPLVLLKTAKGNHMKFDHDNKYFNQREIDAFLDNEFIEQVPEIKKVRSLGFISPYRRQVEKANDAVKKSYNDAVVDTVHKFQGKECEAVLFSTVLDNKAGKQVDFVDNSLLLNVAISRAEKIFILNTSEEKFLKNNKGIADLIRYINYYGEYSIRHQSQVRSIFDLLQKDFSKELELKKAKMLKKHSRFDSENLTMALIQKILLEEDYKHIKCSAEYRLDSLVRQVDNLNKEERRYILNGARLDFVFYFQSGKNPVAAIEVDGHKWHRWPKQKVKDGMKDSILGKYDIKINRLSTNGSQEELQIRKLLDSIC